MKNLLLASTALVAFAGAAAAEVAISGSGRMGMVYDDQQRVNGNYVRGDGGTLVRVADSGFRFSSRVRIAFTLTQETDSGVTFGGSVRADNASAGNSGKAGSVFLSGAFGKISMGDVDGAAESAVGNLSGVGYTNLNDLNEAFFLQQGNDDLDGNEDISEFSLPAVLAEYTSGGFSGYISLGNPAGIAYETTIFDVSEIDLITNDLIVTAKVSDTVIDNGYGLAGSYTVDNYSFGIGFESVDVSGLFTDIGEDGVFGDNPIDAGPDGLDGNDDDIVEESDDVVTAFDSTVENWILGGSATFGGFTFKAQYGEASSDSFDYTQYGLSGDYTFDAFTVTAFWRSTELDRTDDTANVERQPFGLGVSYDLGGGAAVKAGAVDPDIEGEDYRADVGVTFSF